MCNDKLCHITKDEKQISTKEGIEHQTKSSQIWEYVEVQEGACAYTFIDKNVFYYLTSSLGTRKKTEALKIQTTKVCSHNAHSAPEVQKQSRYSHVSGPVPLPAYKHRINGTQTLHPFTAWTVSHCLQSFGAQCRVSLLHTPSCLVSWKCFRYMFHYKQN